MEATSILTRGKVVKVEVNRRELRRVGLLGTKVVMETGFYGVLPQQLDCGSLADDLEFVEAAHAHREQATPLMFMHLGSLLCALAKSVPSFTSPADQSTE